MLLVTHWLVKVQGIGESMPSNMFLLSNLNYRVLLNILLGPPNHNSQSFPIDTHELKSWAENEMICHGVKPWVLMK